MDKSCDPQATLICPTCGGCMPDDSTVCPDCHEDLAGLVQVERRYAILYNEALALARQDRLSEAQDRLVAALTLRPDFGQGHALLAKVHAHRAEWAQAQASIQKALELTPDDAALAAMGAQIEVEARRAEAAQALISTPAEGHAEARRRRALALYERDVAAAFALGLGLASAAAVVASWVRGLLRHRG